VEVTEMTKLSCLLRNAEFVDAGHNEPAVAAVEQAPRRVTELTKTFLSVLSPAF